MSYPLKSYIDSHKLLGKSWHATGKDSGGDSAQRMGMYHSGIYFLNLLQIDVPSEYIDGPGAFEDSISRLFSPKGYWRRHSDENRWYGSWDRMSRDQITSILVCLGLNKKWSVLARTFFRHLFFRGLLFMTNTRRNGSTAQNNGEEYSPGKFRDYSWKLPDLTLFENWSLYIRCLPKPFGFLGYLVLLLADLQTLVGGLIRNKNDDKDVLNHCIISVNATVNYPTPIIYLANRLTNWDLMAEKMERYFDPTEPPLHKIWIPLIKELK